MVTSVTGNFRYCDWGLKDLVKIFGIVYRSFTHSKFCIQGFQISAVTSWGVYRTAALHSEQPTSILVIQIT